MGEINGSEAVWYGIKHLGYIFVVYIIGLGLLFFGTIMGVESNNGISLLILIAGIIFILGGIHGAIYKISGDATERVLQNYIKSGENKVEMADQNQSDVDWNELQSAVEED
jgi:hypothetical protein